MRDIFDYLAEEYTKAGFELNDHDASFNNFIDFSRKQLLKNPPVNMRYLDVGFGVQLQSGDVLSLNNAAVMTNTMYDTSIAVIGSTASAGRGIVNAGAINVTGSSS